MCVCGCPDQSSMHAETLVTFAVDMLRTLKTLNEDLGTDIHIRIGDIFCLRNVNFSGINTGPVVAGVIGTSKVFYDIWGPAGIKLKSTTSIRLVNLAARMEQFGVPDSIQVTESTYELCKSKFAFKARGEIEIKGNVKVKAFLCQPFIERLSTTSETVGSGRFTGARLRSRPYFFLTLT